MRKRSYVGLVGILCFSLLLGSGCSTFKKWLGMEEEKKDENGGGQEEIVKQDTSKVAPAAPLPQQNVSGSKSIASLSKALKQGVGTGIDAGMFCEFSSAATPPFGNPVKITRTENPDGSETWTFPDGTTAQVIIGAVVDENGELTGQTSDTDKGAIIYPGNIVIAFTKNSDGSVTYTYPGMGTLTVKTDGTWTASVTEDGLTLTASGHWSENGSGSCTVNIPTDPTTGINAGNLTWNWSADGSGTLKGDISVIPSAILPGASGEIGIHFETTRKADGSGTVQMNFSCDITGAYTEGEETTMDWTVNMNVSFAKDKSGSLNVVSSGQVTMTIAEQTSSLSLEGIFSCDFDASGTAVAGTTQASGIFLA